MNLLFLIILFIPLSLVAKTNDLKKNNWEPVSIELKLTSDLKVNAFYLKKKTPSPVEGILLTRNAFTSINTKLKICNQNLEKSVEEQRQLCDIQIKECNSNCLKINEQLILDKQKLVDKLLLKEKEYKALEFTNKVILISTSSFITILTVSLLYATL